MKNCPKCESEMESIEDEPDVGIRGGYVCTNENCGHTADFDDEPVGDEVI